MVRPRNGKCVADIKVGNLPRVRKSFVCKDEAERFEAATRESLKAKEGTFTDVHVTGEIRFPASAIHFLHINALESVAATQMRAILKSLKVGLRQIAMRMRGARERATDGASNGGADHKLTFVCNQGNNKKWAIICR